MKKVLIVEDDTHINEMLCDLLRQNGFEPTAAYSGTEALLNLKSGGFSLMLLDLMLPGKTGEETLQEVRKTSDIPVIVLTAIADKETTVKLLRLGADDYLAKPFDNDELLARIDVRLRLSESAKGKSLIFGDIVLDLEGFDAKIGGIGAGLSKKEFDILRLLISHPNKVFSKNNLYESVWGSDYMGDDNTISVHISNLRTKLAALNPDREHIQTVWGIGYKMKF